MNRWVFLLTPFFLYLPTSHSQAAELNFQTYGFNSGLAFNIHFGIREFMTQVEKDCGKKIDFQIHRFQRIEDLKSKKLMETQGAKSLVYETDFLKLLKDHPALESRDPKTIRIIHVSSLQNRCGFATPAFLLQDSSLAAKDKANLANTLLISDELAQCGSFTRLIGHELGHLLIQDDPPHVCLVQGNPAPCPPQNILSDQRKQNQYFPMAGKMKPPQVVLGSEITPDQCKKIRATIERLQAP